MNTESEVKSKLSELIGLRLSIARDAGSTKVFQFGNIRRSPSGRGTSGDFSLHLQCPWRLVKSGAILTGLGDYFWAEDEDEDVDLDNYKAGNLQRVRLQTLFQTYDPGTRSLVNLSDSMIVLSVNADPLGGFDIELSGDIRLQVFPDGSRAENWRVFPKRSGEPHFVHPPQI